MPGADAAVLTFRLDEQQVDGICKEMARVGVVARSLAPNMFDFGFVRVEKRAYVRFLALELPDGSEFCFPLADPVAGGAFGNWMALRHVIFSGWLSRYVSAVSWCAERCRAEALAAGQDGVDRAALNSLRQRVVREA